MNLLLAQVPSFISDKPWLVFVAGSAAIFVMYRKEIMAVIGKYSPSIKPSTIITTEDLDISDLLALKRLEDRAERQNCKELTAAVDQCFRCFFDEDPEEGEK